MMVTSEFSLLAVFLTGLLGGVHCAGMCGGIVSALGMVTQKPASSLRRIPVTVHQSGSVADMHPAVAPAVISAGRTAIHVSAYNIGRILTYTLLGGLAGGIGSMAWLMQTMLPIQQSAFFISNVLLVLMGLYVLGVKKIGTVVESWGSVLWTRVRPHATARLTGASLINTVITGSLWGLVPCGMVYAVLSAALVSGSVTRGALLMLAFGLGTLPNLMALGLSGQWLARASRQLMVRRIAGTLIIVFGIMGLMHMIMMMLGTHSAA